MAIKGFNPFDPDIEVLVAAATQGDPKAQCELADYYLVGHLVPQDDKKGIQWLRKAAEQGSGDALCRLGSCHADGEGVSKDWVKAVEYYLKAAEVGDTLAFYYLGECYKDGKGVERDFDQAIHWFEKAAAQGEDSASRELQIEFETLWSPKGDSPDLSWPLAVARHGHVVTQYALALLYTNRGNPELAVPWYQAAAENGNLHAKCDLARCFARGTGTPKNVEQAIRWYESAADQDDDYSMYELGRLYADDTHFRDMKRAFNLWTRVTELTDEEPGYQAEFELSWCYYLGEGIEADFEEAIKSLIHGQKALPYHILRGPDTNRWWMRRVNSGDPDAMYWLGECYNECLQSDEHPEVIYKNAFTWYMKAAELGNPEAQNAVAHFLRDGRRGIPANQEEALRWFRLAADQGQPDAIKALNSIK